MTDYEHTMTKDSKITMATEDLERMTDSNGDLVERVARTICANEGNAPDDPIAPYDDDAGLAMWKSYQGEARAAIAAVLDDLEARVAALSIETLRDVAGVCADIRKELGL